MAWTQAELDAIEQAYKSGIKRVQFKDRATDFRDLAEMKQIINDARTELGGTKRKPHFYTRYDRGYQ